MSSQASSQTAQETAGAPLIWRGDALDILDQRLLPQQESYIHATDAAMVTQAIRDLAVRGAPAIGIAAAYGVVLAAQVCSRRGETPSYQALSADLASLEGARPTAVNLAWALRQMRQVADAAGSDQRGWQVAALEREALRIHQEERESNQRMAELGAALIEPGSRVLTVCNTGGLATGGSGTALAVIIEAWRQGRLEEAFAAETRPWFQGARLTTWELGRAGVKHRLLVDSAVPWLMKNQGIDWVIVGADRVAANGDTANKIGTYAAALAAKAHGAKTMVVIPTTTLDLTTANGAAIPIEERDPREVTAPAGRETAPAGTRVWNPVFDVTPAELVDALVTERGVVLHPNEAALRALMG